MNSKAENPKEKEAYNPEIPKEYDILSEVKIKFSARLGGCTMLVRDLINLHKESIIQLDRLAGDTADILINGVPIAKGEVIMIGQNFGVRITEFITIEK